MGAEGGQKKRFVLDFFGCFIRSLLPAPPSLPALLPALFRISPDSLVDVSVFFVFSSAPGRGRGSPGRQGGGGVGFLLKLPGGRGCLPGGGGRGLGAGRVSAGNLGDWGGGGARYFFSGPKCPPRFGFCSRPSRK